MAQLAEDLISKAEHGVPELPKGGRLDAYFHNAEIKHTHREGAKGVPVFALPTRAQRRRLSRAIEREKWKKSHDNEES